MDDAAGIAPLRAHVLAGRFFGTTAAAAAEAVAAFIVEASPAQALRRWFGAMLDDIIACDGGPPACALALARLEEAVDRDIAALDLLLSRQLDAVLHHERLRRLEGSWRGLWWLADLVPYGTKAKIKTLSVRWPELCRDFDRSPEFDQSQLFKKVYEEEYGHPGGEPYGMLVADFEIRHGPGPGWPTDDITALGSLSAVAAGAFAPLAIAAQPSLLGLDNFGDASAAADLAEPLRGTERARWRNLQSRADTRFLAVLLPRLLGRVPWDYQGGRPDRFRYRELAPGTTSRVWVNPAYALAMTAIRAYAINGWPAEIRGSLVNEDPRGGVVSGLPSERLSADPPGPPPRPPIELALTDDQERQAVEAGLIPLIGLEFINEASFAAMPSLHRPPRMDRDAANANQRLSAQFNALLCVSRFAHCIKLMGRDMVGSFQTSTDIQRRLSSWLMQFTNSSAPAADEVGTRYPLRGCAVEVTEKPGQPGVYGCTIHLQPHYQLDEVGASFRLVTDLEAARAIA